MCEGPLKNANYLDLSSSFSFHFTSYYDYLVSMCARERQLQRVRQSLRQVSHRWLLVEPTLVQLERPQTLTRERGQKVSMDPLGLPNLELR